MNPLSGSSVDRMHDSSLFTGLSDLVFMGGNEIQTRPLQVVPFGAHVIFLSGEILKLLQFLPPPGQRIKSLLPVSGMPPPSSGTRSQANRDRAELLFNIRGDS